MFDIGWSEFLIVGAVALVLLGPDELPGLLRTIGRYTGMVRRQAADFRRHFDEAMREAELDKLRREVEEAARSTSNEMREVEGSIGGAASASNYKSTPSYPMPRTPAPIPPQPAPEHALAPASSEPAPRAADKDIPSSPAVMPPVMGSGAGNGA